LRDRVEQLMAPLYARLMAVLGLLLLPIVIYSIIAAMAPIVKDAPRASKPCPARRVAASQDQSLTDSAERLLMALDPRRCRPQSAAPVGELRRTDGRDRRGFQDRYSYIGITDALGHVLCSSHAEAVGLDLADRPWWQETRKSDEIIVSDLIESKLTAEPIVTVQHLWATRSPPSAVSYSSASTRMR